MKGFLDRSSILLISTNFKPISIVDVGFFMQFSIFLDFCIFTCYHSSCKKKHFNRWPNYFLGGWYNVSDFQQCFFLDCRTCWNRFLSSLLHEGWVQKTHATICLWCSMCGCQRRNHDYGRNFGQLLCS